MACFYEMQELGLPFTRKSLLEGEAEHLKLHKPAPSINLSNGQTINIGSGEVTTDQPLGVRSFYTLRVCKDCRALWMAAISGWFKNPQTHQEVGSGIFVRRNGANVEITEEEWERLNPGREPVRAYCNSCNNTRKILEDHEGRAGYRPCPECQ
jgi:hypothetical protein